MKDGKQEKICISVIEDDTIAYLEMARLAMAMVGDEIAEEMDLSDEEFLRLRDQLQRLMED
tara:strand:- start:49 stop:231 length:183 start_codon:yes stop_codon:yes gene_type:complete